MITIFISYSHKDRKWKDRISKHLAVPAAAGTIDLSVWDDSQIAAGRDWLPSIGSAIAQSSVGILLISADFLTSRFVLEQEVPALLQRRLNQDFRLIPLVVHECAWRQVPWLASIQARPLDGRALSSLTRPKADTALADLTTELLAHPVTPVSFREPPTQPNDASANKEAAIRLRVEVAVDDMLRAHLLDKVDVRLTDRIKEIVAAPYGPFNALSQAIDARIEHELLPLVSRVIAFELQLRSKHAAPFSDQSIQVLRERLLALIGQRWSAAVDGAALDAEDHVCDKVGQVPPYKQRELSELVESFKGSKDFRGLSKIIDQELKKALAESLLGGA